MSVALNASSDPFRFYSEGILMMSDGCSTSVDHVVALVGYGETEGTGEEVIIPGECRRATRRERRRRECAGDLTYVNLGRGKRNKLCCSEDEVVIDEGMGYWKLQNSWGAGWGQDGFIFMEAAGGDGVCNMNSELRYVELTSTED